MTSHRDPLACPTRNEPIVGALLEHLGVDQEEGGKRGELALLEVVGAAFARLPYENLTKILKSERLVDPERALRGPREVIEDHIRLGTGGTCFSLTAALLFVMRALGFDAEPLLADRHYGDDTHCGLVVRVGNKRYLLDPGFLLMRPVPIDGTRRVICTAFNDIVLEPLADGGRVAVHTCQNNAQVRRFTFKTDPADDAAFVRAWRGSFGWDMMRYPVLACVGGEDQKYLQGHRLQFRSRGALESAELRVDELVARISQEFGLRRGVAAAALRVLARRREGSGKS